MRSLEPNQSQQKSNFSLAIGIMIFTLVTLGSLLVFTEIKHLKENSIPLSDAKMISKTYASLLEANRLGIIDSETYDDYLEQLDSASIIGVDLIRFKIEGMITAHKIESETSIQDSLQGQ